jgi:hypothetical protein
MAWGSKTQLFFAHLRFAVFTEAADSKWGREESPTHSNGLDGDMASHEGK